MLTFLFACSIIADQLGDPADSTDTAEIIVTIPKGINSRSLGKVLAKHNVIESADRFTNYVRITKEGSCLKAGRFSLSRSLSAAEIIQKVCGTPLANDKAFTVVEGWRIREIDAALTEQGWIKAGAYAALAAQPSQFQSDYPLPSDTLEGYLYPETYMLSVDNFDPQQFIQRQLDTLSKVFIAPNKNTIESSGRSLNELMIVASMVEREEPKDQNMPLVSGIIWKRLDSGWNLGIDATSHYSLEDWNDRKGLLRQLRDKSDPYNTRLRKGLPPTPIGAPGISALNATLSPEASEYWYYLHDSTQTIRPARNAREHEQNRRTYNVY